MVCLHGVRAGAAAERVRLTSGGVFNPWAFAKFLWLIEAMESVLFCSVAGDDCLGVVEHTGDYSLTGREEVKSQETHKMILEFFLNLKISLTGCKAQTKNECVLFSLSASIFTPYPELSI